jgi:hypothetical protein
LYSKRSLSNDVVSCDFHAAIEKSQAKIRMKSPQLVMRPERGLSIGSSAVYVVLLFVFMTVTSDVKEVTHYGRNTAAPM